MILESINTKNRINPNKGLGNLILTEVISVLVILCHLITNKDSFIVNMVNGKVKVNNLEEDTL